MQTRPSSCEGCTLHDKNIAIGYQTPEGLGTSGVLVVGSSLDAKGAQDSLPFRPNSPAGSIFAGLIRRIPGLQRQDLLLSNTVWCQPGKSNWLAGAPYEYSAVTHCSQYNRDLIAKRKPKVVLALGALPTGDITGLKGYNQGIKLLRGYILEAKHPGYVDESGKPLLVVPTYAPEFLLRASKTRIKDPDGERTGAKLDKAEGGMALSGVVIRDIQLALGIAKSGFAGHHKFESVHASRENMEEYYRFLVAHPELAIGWDIETPRSLTMAEDESEIDSIQADVTQIQFATDKDRGFIIPGGFRTAWGKEISARILALPNVKYSWNGWKFDNKVVVGHHGLVINGVDIDLMKAWAWIQPDLPQGLQFATSFHAPQLHPWKHLASEGFDDSGDGGTPWGGNHYENMDVYGACDVISLHFNAEGIFEVMNQRGLRTSFDRHVLMLRNELVAASHRGFPLDPAQHEVFGKKIGKEQDALSIKIRAQIPEEVLSIHPKPDKKKKQIGFGYVGIPRAIKDLLDEAGNPKDGSDRVVIEEEVTDEDTEEITIEKVVYTRRTVNVFSTVTLSDEPTLRWVRIIPFSHNSGPQIKKYIEFRRAEEIARRMAKGQHESDANRLAKYKVPLVRDKKDKSLKENTGAKELDKLYKSTEDEVFHLIVEVKKLNKLYGTYYKGWQVTREGKLVSPEFVHTTFGVADTGTGQLSSTDPNIQNAPKHGDLAKEFRATIRAKEGKVLLEFDKKAFHAQTLAFLAKDKAYARVSALDVHSYMTAFRLKLPEASQLLTWSDSDIKLWLKKMKADPFKYKEEAVPNIPDGLTFQQIRDYKSKRVILGLGFAQGAKSIYEQNPESYKSAKEVQEFIDMLWKVFPDIKKFHTSITQLAHKQTYLLSPWGYIRRFFDVFQWDSTKWNNFTNSQGDWKHGDDYEAAIAFLPANCAFGMIKEEMLRLAGYRMTPDMLVGGPYTHPYEKERFEYDQYLRTNFKHSEDLLVKYGLVNQVHDSLVFHCDLSLRDRCIEDVLHIMREPCLILSDPEMALNGLFVDSDVQVGPDWAHMGPVTP